jgi:hypothetical protein
MAPGIFFMPGVSMTETMPCRAQIAAIMSVNALLLRKKNTQTTGVTTPPDLRFET